MRSIPGTEMPEGREHVYLCFSDRLSFDKAFDSIPLADSAALPASGGMISENIQLTAPDGKTYWGISYKGDLQGWRKAVNDYAIRHSIETARVALGVLETSGGASYEVSKCKASYYAD